MAFNPAGVDDAIAALVVSGLTLYTQATVPDEIDLPRGNPRLYPAGEFITGLTMVELSAMANTPVMQFDYTVNYLLAYEKIGAGRKLKDWLRATTSLAVLFCTAVTNNQHSLSATHVLPSGFQTAIVEDYVGNQFYGATISINVREYLNL